jgi:hypothetical protein
MTLAGALEGLCVASNALSGALSAARTSVCEDRPEGVSPLAVDELADAMIELDGEAEALRRQIDAVVLGPAAPSRQQALQLVSVSQCALNDIADGVASRVAACDKLAEVERVARRRGAPWGAWWGAATRGVAECEPALRDLRDSLLACWRELAETAGPTIRGGSEALGFAVAAGEASLADAGGASQSAHFTLPDHAEGTRGGQEA